MQKIPTIFERDWSGDRSRVIDKPHPDCAWVFAGEGLAMRKYDGTACMIHNGDLFKRREVTQGAPLPSGWVLADRDNETGKVVGWVPVGDGAEDQWHREALEVASAVPTSGTYELLGPKVQGNPERLPRHVLLLHKSAQSFGGVPTDFEGLKTWLAERDIEGLVWHHPDGRMAKIKLRDFGLKRPRREPVGVGEALRPEPSNGEHSLK